MICLTKRAQYRIGWLTTCVLVDLSWRSTSARGSSGRIHRSFWSNRHRAQRNYLHTLSSKHEIKWRLNQIRTLFEAHIVAFEYLKYVWVIVPLRYGSLDLRGSFLIFVIFLFFTWTLSGSTIKKTNFWCAFPYLWM